MGSLGQPLRKLRWQLSLPYIIVVLITLLMLFGLGWAVVLLTPPLSPSEQLVLMLEKSAAPLVMRDIRTNSSGGLEVDKTARPYQRVVAADLNVNQVLGAMILDTGGRVLTVDGANGAQVKELYMQPASQEVIRAALTNDPRLASRIFTAPDGRSMATAPLIDSQKRTIGVLAVAVKGLKEGKTTSNPMLDVLLRIFGLDGQEGVPAINGLRTVLLIILVFSIISIAFGIATARSITRRLREIASVAHAWSLGQFEVAIHDRSPDELGQLAQDLNQMAQQVQELLETRHELGLMEERQRVARDLHDSVKQHTFAISLLIGAAQTKLPAHPEAAQACLTRAEELADNTRQELGTILQQLRPPSLAGKELQAALHDYARQWSQRSGIGIQFSVSGAASVPFDIEEDIFRIAQEALANVARHSQASQVQIQLEQETGAIQLSIQDNGRGFEKQRDEGEGWGLANMRERAEHQQGVLHITSTPQGARVKVCIPLDRSLQHAKIPS